MELRKKMGRQDQERAWKTDKTTNFGHLRLLGMKRGVCLLCQSSETLQIGTSVVISFRFTGRSSIVASNEHYCALRSNKVPGVVSREGLIEVSFCTLFFL